jgi:hypothetical protein
VTWVSVASGSDNCSSSRAGVAVAWSRRHQVTVLWGTHGLCFAHAWRKSATLPSHGRVLQTRYHCRRQGRPSGTGCARGSLKAQGYFCFHREAQGYWTGPKGGEEEGSCGVLGHTAETARPTDGQSTRRGVFLAAARHRSRMDNSFF